jgi:L,D-peptidoglycan transpeptidase YkuD (ErfK/YbiS/YcfS/YnhG family)
MGFRFRKTFKVAPGIKLNLSKSGVSTSIGGRGLTANLRGGRAKTTVGVPGTGLSFSSITRSSISGGSVLWLIGIAIVVALLFAAL